MNRTKISEGDEWELENPDQDIRGWTAVDDSGQELGRITDLLVDEDRQVIDGIVLDSGQEYHDTNWRAGDGKVVVSSASTTDYGSAATASGDEAASERDTMRVRRHAEELRAEKERVQAGEVKVRKDVAEEERTIDVPVTREEVEVRRYAVDRPASEAEIVDTGDTIRVPVMGERVDVQKDVRVAEELEISKRPVTETKRVSDTVREERIDITQEGDVDVADDTDVTTRR